MALSRSTTVAAMAQSAFDIPIPGKDARAIALGDRVDILKQVPLFAGAAKRHLRHLAKRSRVEQFEPGQPLVSEGQTSTVAFVVVAGSAVVRRNGRKIAEIGAGDVVGEIGLLTGRPRTGTVQATTPLEAIAVDKRGLRAAVEEFPAFGWYLVETVADRLSS